MLRDSVVVVVVVVVVRTRPRAIPLAMIAIRKILHGFPFLSRDAYGAPLGGPSGCRSSAITMFYISSRHITSRLQYENKTAVRYRKPLCKVNVGTKWDGRT